MATIRSHGKNGALWLQVGNTTVAGPTSCTGNAAIEVVDGVAYDPYQVWTLSVGANIPQDPSDDPTVVVGGTGLPTAYTYDWRPMRGKLIFTPTLGAAGTVSMSAYAIPKLYQQGDVTEFSIDTDQDLADATAMGDGWGRKVKGFPNWKGSASVFWKGTSFWSAGPGGNSDAPVVLRFYPNRTVTTEYWYGSAFLSWGIKVSKGDMVAQSLTFTGTDALVSVGF